MSTTEDGPKRGGKVATGHRRKLSFRASDILNEKLEAECAATGRSLSEEVEMRVEASFAQPSPHSAPVLALLGATISFVETMMGETWRDNESVALEVGAGLREIIDRRIRAEGSGSVERISAALLRHAGQGGRAAARFVDGAKVSTEQEGQEFMEGLARMMGHRAENDPSFMNKLVEVVKNGPNEPG